MILDLDYLMDFEALVDSGNFSRAASFRNVTQPAFSRRIQALEEWAGAALFERALQPISLTEPGRALQPKIADALRSLEQGRADAAAAAARNRGTLRFAATHVLSFAFFPRWLCGIENGRYLDAVQLTTDSLQACERLMLHSQADFLLCHHHALAPVRLDPSLFQSIRIGSDALCPVTAPGSDGSPLFDLCETQKNTVPCLDYKKDSGLSRIISAAQPTQLASKRLETVFTSHHAVVLRTMAEVGRGVAWLPESLVVDDLALGSLVRAGPPSMDIQVEIHLFRAATTSGSRAVEQFWSLLAASPH